MFERIDMPALEQELIALRREFHRYPETGWTELRTSVRIIEELEKLGVPVQYGHGIHVAEKRYAVPSDEVLEQHRLRALEETGRADLVNAMAGGFTGCVAYIEGALPGPTVALRVDIDCNQLQESIDPAHIPAAEGFRSVHEGCMHACGHDAHAAIGIGAAKLLWAYRDQLRGRVVLVFQPGEEGLQGSASLVAAGHFDDVDQLFGLHVGLRSNPVGMAAAGVHGFLASKKMQVTFLGKAAHAGASPDVGRNALAAGATAALNLLAIPRHHAGTSRVNVGTFHSGTGYNVIPAKAELGVETRGATAAVGEFMDESAQRICRAAAEMHGCGCEIRFLGAAGTAECDAALVQWTAQRLAEVEGITQVQDDFDFGASEDITNMMRVVQAHGGEATEVIIGMPLIAPHHNDRFDIREEVIGIGARALAHLAMRAADKK